MKNVKLKKLNILDEKQFITDYKFYLENLNLKADEFVNVAIHLIQSNHNVVNLFYDVKYREKNNEIFYITYVVDELNLANYFQFFNDFNKNNPSSKVKNFKFDNFHYIKS
ncbi:hypothetical protein [[Mycoplasma] collis]|uniref:hypothetical protein n=1 Tax=[Mycoplasma] collis TaxID=2127 RepID=UPI0012EB0635|nr:hypothetical protein [[Mycoplasma] collis]